MDQDLYQENRVWRSLVEIYKAKVPKGGAEPDTTWQNCGHEVEKHGYNMDMFLVQREFVDYRLKRGDVSPLQHKMWSQNL